MPYNLLTKRFQFPRRAKISVSRFMNIKYYAYVYIEQGLCVCGINRRQQVECLPVFLLENRTEEAFMTIPPHFMYVGTWCALQRVGAL